MTKFEDRLYDYEKIEWDKIQDFIGLKGCITKSSNDKRVINQFESIKEYKPFEIIQTWKYSKDKIVFDIICIDYSYREREQIGDGEIGTPSRITNFKFTSFWFIVKNTIKIPRIVIVPINSIKKINQLINRNFLNGKLRFNLNYAIDTNNIEKAKSILNEDVQSLFVERKRIWFESSDNTILIRDDKPIDFKSFENKFKFTKELIEKRKLMRTMHPRP